DLDQQGMQLADFKTFDQFYDPKIQKTQRAKTILISTYLHKPITHIKHLSDGSFVCSTNKNVYLFEIKKGEKNSHTFTTTKLYAGTQPINALTICDDTVIFAAENTIHIGSKNSSGTYPIEEHTYFESITDLWITALCAYKDKDSILHIVTGTEDCYFTISKHSSVNLYQKDSSWQRIAQLKYDQPISSIEMNADQTFILVKTTELTTKNNARVWVDHAYVYPVFKSAFTSTTINPLTLYFEQPYFDKKDSPLELYRQIISTCQLYNGSLSSNNLNSMQHKITNHEIKDFTDFQKLLSLYIDVLKDKESNQQKNMNTCFNTLPLTLQTTFLSFIEQKLRSQTSYNNNEMIRFKQHFSNNSVRIINNLFQQELNYKINLWQSLNDNNISPHHCLQLILSNPYHWQKKTGIGLIAALLFGGIIYALKYTTA